MKSNNSSNEYQKAIDFLEKGCDCGCSSRIPKEQFAELRESFQALSKCHQLCLGEHELIDDNRNVFNYVDQNEMAY